MSQLTPYGYQEKCLSVLGKVRIGGKNKALVVMASGLGKTVVAAFEVSNYLSTFGGRALYLCHQNDILDQAHETFRAVFEMGYLFGHLDGQHKDLNPVDVLFASFQTMRNWRDRFNPGVFDYIVVDESHHSPAETYLPTLEYFKPRFLLGMTATPDRTDLQDIREIYGDEVYSLPLEDGLAQGLLAPVEYRLVTDEIQNLSVLDTPIGKLSIKMLNRELFIPKRDEEIAKIIQEKITEVHDPRVMIFTPSIAYCNRLAALLPEASSIHSEMPLNEQADILRKFRAREINTIITVDKFNEGIDVPDANIIVFLRSTASRTIFFQQLGRGLRKTEGKERVLVLDFVANCERLEMVHKLWAAVEGKVIGPGPVYPPIEGPFIVDIGKIVFTEDARDVLDVIRGVRVGYTKEILIKQLKDVASKLGFTPGKRDVDRAASNGECASSRTLATYFGSFNDALLAAGLDPKLVRKTAVELKAELGALEKELGRTPGAYDIDIASRQGKCASRGVYVREFGSFNNALKAAGLAPQMVRRTDKELKEDLKALEKKHGRTPTVKDVHEACKRGECASVGAYTRRFGSFNKAKREAGLTVHEPPTVKTEAELVNDLKVLEKKLGRTPMVSDVREASKRGECASLTAFYNHFGSLPNAVSAAGLEPNRGGRPSR